MSRYQLVDKRTGEIVEELPHRRTRPAVRHSKQSSLGEWQTDLLMLAIAFAVFWILT